VFENRLVRKYLYLERIKLVNSVGYCTTRNLVIYTGHLVLLG